MVKDLVANSPFINIEFIKSSEKINEPDSKVLFDYYKLDSNTISFQINRDFSDYRITPYFSDDQIGDLKIKNFELDSLSYFQIKQFLNQNTFTSIEIIKSDISVYLELPNSYESYLNELSKKNRHELKRKKRIFEERFGETVFDRLWKNFIAPYLNKKIGIFITLSRTILWFLPLLYMSQKQ